MLLDLGVGGGTLWRVPSRFLERLRVAEGAEVLAKEKARKAKTSSRGASPCLETGYLYDRKYGVPREGVKFVNFFFFFQVFV